LKTYMKKNLFKNRSSSFIHRGYRVSVPLKKFKKKTKKNGFLVEQEVRVNLPRSCRRNIRQYLEHA